MTVYEIAMTEKRIKSNKIEKSARRIETYKKIFDKNWGGFYKFFSNFFEKFCKKIMKKQIYIVVCN